MRAVLRSAGPLLLILAVCRGWGGAGSVRASAGAAAAAAPASAPRAASNVCGSRRPCQAAARQRLLAPLQAAGEQRARSFVFAAGRLQLRPQDAVEAQQLELSTARPSLDYAFDELALFCTRAAGEALARRPEAADADAATLKRLADVRTRWLA